MYMYIQCTCNLPCTQWCVTLYQHVHVYTCTWLCNMYTHPHVCDICCRSCYRRLRSPRRSWWGPCSPWPWASLNRESSFSSTAGKTAQSRTLVSATSGNMPVRLHVGHGSASGCKSIKTGQWIICMGVYIHVPGICVGIMFSSSVCQLHVHVHVFTPHIQYMCTTHAQFSIHMYTQCNCFVYCTCTLQYIHVHVCMCIQYSTTCLFNTRRMIY